MPLRPSPYRFGALNPESFHGLPGLLSDSLPDRYGHALIDAWLAGQGRAPESFDSVEQLSDRNAVLSRACARKESPREGHAQARSDSVCSARSAPVVVVMTAAAEPPSARRTSRGVRMRSAAASA